jgi:3-hydroxy acid dehydrogenase / malonic semialdehyde reductase
MPIALITGSTSGIGEATAHLLAQQGYDLIINGRRKERLDALTKHLQDSYSIKILQMHLDVTDSESVSEFFQNLPDEWRSINVVINNAGLAAGLDNLENGSLDDWNAMIDTNVKGLLHVTKYAIPLLKNTLGHVVNIGSIAGKEVYANGNVYCGTKHMVDALNKAMRRELAESGVRFSAIHPGAVETEFSLVRLKGDAAKAAAVYDGYKNLVAQDIADAIWYVISRPRHVNINELTIMPTAQPAAGVIIRNKGI